MNQILSAPVSVFHGATLAKPTGQMALGPLLERIKGGYFRLFVEELRHIKATESAEAYRAAKAKSWAFSPAGLFARRANTQLLEASGLLNFDLDHLQDVAGAKRLLSTEPWIVYLFLSPGGDGLKLGVLADGIHDDRSYKQAWNAALGYFERVYPALALSNDKACCDISRLCFVSWDPGLYMNPEAHISALRGLGETALLVQIEQTSEARGKEKPSETGRSGLPHPLPLRWLVIDKQGASSPVLCAWRSPVAATVGHWAAAAWSLSW